MEIQLSGVASIQGFYGFVLNHHSTPPSNFKIVFKREKRFTVQRISSSFLSSEGFNVLLQQVNFE